MERSPWNGYPGPEPLPMYLVNVAIRTGKVREFDEVWKVVTCSCDGSSGTDLIIF